MVGSGTIKLILLLFLVGLNVNDVLAVKNFLFLNGVASLSHHLWNRVLMEGLAANKDYNLTILSADMENKTLPNMHYIQLEQVYSELYSGDEGLDLMDMVKDTSPTKGIWDVIDYEMLSCRGIFKSEGLQTILNYPDDFKFDMVLSDYVLGPCLLPLLHKFKYPPLVSFTAFNNPWNKQYLIGGHFYTSYVPFWTLINGGEMNFPQRLYNAYLHAYQYLVDKVYLYPLLNKMVQEVYKFENLPPLEDLEAKTRLVLWNSDFAFDFSEPVPPNAVQIGCLQVANPKPLPEDLDAFIRKGKKGTVVMSLGTNWKSEMLGKETLINILTTFKTLSDYNFIWKFEADELPVEKPANVEISKFLPLKDILAHPNIKAFVTHGGVLSMQESLWYGKPMVGMPFFTDQYRNLARAMYLGTAERILYKEFSDERFTQLLRNVLEIPSYSENAQKISQRLRDHPDKPLDRAIWWIEYVLRNPDPDHLSSPTVKMGYFVSNGYDVLLFVVAIILIAIYSIKKAVKVIVKKFQCKSALRSKKTN